MRKTKRSKAEDVWLASLGIQISKLIKKKGHNSPYEFWINDIGDEISRANLNYVLNGRVDMKATTLKKIADALGVEYSDLFDFK